VLQLDACQLIDMAAHPFLAGRTTAKVAVTLSEAAGSVTVSHDLRVSAWCDYEPTMSDEDLREALLDHARRIVRRVIAADLRATMSPDASLNAPLQP